MLEHVRSPAVLATGAGAALLAAAAATITQRR